MFHRIANLIARRPGRLLVIAVVVTAASAVLSAGLEDRLASQGFFDPDAESSDALRQIERATGGEPDLSVIALVRAPGGGQVLKHPDTAGRVAKVARVFAADPDTAKVIPPIDGGKPLPQMISRDGRIAMVVAEVDPAKREGDASERFKEKLGDEPYVSLGGSLLAQEEVSATVGDDLRTAEMIAFPLLFLLALFVFRGLIAAALPLIVGAITIPITFAFVSLFDQLTDLSVFALNLITGLGLGLAIDYSLLMVTRFREELEAGAEPRAAVTTTVLTAGRTVLFSAFTVAGSTAVLGIFPLKFLYSMGIGGATVALVAATVSLTVLPALLALFGRRVNAFSLARRTTAQSQAAWYGLARGVMRHPFPVAGVTIAAIVVLALPAAGIRFTSVDHTVLPKDSEPRLVQESLESEFAGGSRATTVYALVSAPRDDRGPIDHVINDAERLGSVHHAGEPMYLGGNLWRVDVFANGSRFSQAAQDTVKTLRELPHPTRVWVGGQTANFVDQRAAIVSHAPYAVAMIGVITFVILFLMTGSVVLPIKTFIMNLATLAATYGLLVFVFQDGRLEGLLDYTSQDALEMTQPILLFAIAFGLATDYGVFLLSRIKELHDSGVGNVEAVALGVSRTGRVITSAALLFCVAVGAFATSQIIFIKELGVGTALAVAIDATIVRALLVPALMAMLGEYNWWAPEPLRKLHRRYGWSETASTPSGRATAEPADEVTTA